MRGRRMLKATAYPIDSRIARVRNAEHLIRIDNESIKSPDMRRTHVINR